MNMNPTPKDIEAAGKSLYDADIIAAILISMGNAEIDGGKAIEGTSLRWLAERLDDALVKISHVIQSTPG